MSPLTSVVQTNTSSKSFPLRCVDETERKRSQVSKRPLLVDDTVCHRQIACGILQSLGKQVVKVWVLMKKMLQLQN